MLQDVHVIRFYGQRTEGKKQYLFLECAGGGELFDRIGKEILILLTHFVFVMLVCGNEIVKLAANKPGYLKVQNIKNPISVKEIKLRPGSDAAPLACSRLSDSGEDVKVKGTQKVGGAKKRKGKEGREGP